MLRSKKRRLNLIANSDFKNYLKYALGEIVLVVLGILIALYIKGLYADKQQTDHLKKVGIQVVENLKQDTSHIGKIVRFYEPMEVTYKQVLGDSLSKEEFKNCGYCVSMVASFQPFTINSSGYDFLKKIDVELKTQEDSLIHLTKQFYSQSLPMMKLLNGMVKDDVTDNLNNWRDTQPWYANWINGVEDDRYYEYVLNDPMYKNRVANYYLLLYKNYLNGLESYSMQAGQLAEKWTEVLQE